ncbi:MobF family relaxase [Amycolatopsis thermoflava]|uniref:MobF family relaxase n=1 Tax=Amycolatopsis thermoflava TaxID=84480 RepID=UPI00380A9D7A
MARPVPGEQRAPPVPAPPRPSANSPQRGRADSPVAGPRPTPRGPATDPRPRRTVRPPPVHKCAFPQLIGTFCTAANVKTLEMSSGDRAIRSIGGLGREVPRGLPVTMTPRVLHAGDGYTYLTRTVASGDVQRERGTSLSDVYAVTGDPPGVWVGSGCADLSISGEVTEEHMLALFGEGLRPDADAFIAERIAEGASIDHAIKAARLGRRMPEYKQDIPLVGALRAAVASFTQQHQRRPTVAERHEIKFEVGRRLLEEKLGHPVTTERKIRRFLQDELGRARQPVSGFDLVFAPVKSVSLLWALGGHRIREEVERAHRDAWQAALAYAEQEAAFARVGAAGVAQIETSGFVATAFDHRESRVGDPHLHTHVAVANRVLAVDGKWRTLDGQQVFKVAVSASEMYNATLEQLLTERLGVQWAPRAVGRGRQPVREVAGMPREWIVGFSRRRAQIEAGYDRLVADYVAAHGRTPSRSVQFRLAQQAQLGRDRPAKVAPVPLDEARARWRSAAGEMTPELSVEERIEACVPGPAAVPRESLVDLAALGAAVVAAVSDKRATWTIYHVRAEALRQLAKVPFESMRERRRALETVVGYAIQRHSVQLDLFPHLTPELLQRSDGEPVFHRRGSTRYTSTEILACEDRLLADTEVRRGPVVSDRVRRRTVREFERSRGISLNPGQQALVEHFVSSGAAIAVGIGPPGGGKSTVMRAVRAAWETTGGRVIGLAPSAAAASVLHDELNAGDPETPGRPPAARADTLHSLTTRYAEGLDLDVEPGDMLLVDEAGMAGTRTLDTVRRIAEERGAVMRLVGDHRQLTAVEAGGTLRLLFHDAGGVELDEVRRFADPEEARAVLRFRVGDPGAIGFYEKHDRLIGGVRAAVLDQLYRDWQADVASGATSIMMSDSRDVARELSARAQADGRARGEVAETGVRLVDDTVAGVGDRVVTRANRRRFTVSGGRDFVKNGDLWTVRAVHDDHSLTVRHVRHGGQVTLPADYVAECVELGYAATVHRSQGLTVDIARAFLSVSAVREAALVALSRGVRGNYAYLDVEEIQEVDEPEVLPGELFYRHRETTLAAKGLARILRREGAERSATEELRDAQEAPFQLDNAVPRYEHALVVWRGENAAAEAEEWVREAMPDHADDIVADEAWPALQNVLHTARAGGADPAALLRETAGQRELATAESVAKVMHYRISEAMPPLDPGPAHPPMLPGWVPAPPPLDDPRHDAEPEVLELAEWLHDRAGDIAVRVQELGERVAEDRPRWAARLGELPDDPLDRATWLEVAGQVAAYRERWGFGDEVDTFLPRDDGGAQRRAHDWVVGFVNGHSAVIGRRSADPGRAERVRAKLGALTSRLTTARRSPVPESSVERREMEPAQGAEPEP